MMTVDELLLLIDNIHRVTRINRQRRQSGLLPLSDKEIAGLAE